MKAMIFAAGLGTRLKPFTLQHPKALVPVRGIPMLERVMRRIIDAGATEIVVNVHHFADQVIEFLHACDWGNAEVIISDESGKLLDTGGGILAARKWLESATEPVLVHNADILTNVNLKEMVEFHVQSHALATLLVKMRPTSRYLVMNKDMDMAGWTNIDTAQVIPSSLEFDNSQLYAFGGVHVLSPDIFPLLEQYGKDDEAFPIMPFYIEECQKHVIKGYVPACDYSWHDIGKPQSLAQAEGDIAF